MVQRIDAYGKIDPSAVINSHAIAALKREAIRESKRSKLQGINAKHISGLYGHNPKQNLLLGALPAEEFGQLLPHLELASVEIGTVVCNSGIQMPYVYFPTSCIVSVLFDTKDGTSTETAVIGPEGLAGVTTFMGDGAMLNSMVIKSTGYAFRMKANVLREQFKRGGALQDYLLRYTQALLTQMSQTAVCNRHHTVVQQLCRWLLLSLDRLPTNELIMTQERIAHMLGVRRESIAEAAAKLQDEGLIHYRRGRIQVMNRPALEQRVCECYACVKGEYDRLLVGRKLT
jgi:CRP-like cAMP-binding protein